MRLLSVCITLALVVVAATERQDRLFDGAFYTNKDNGNVHWRAEMRLGDLQTTMAQITSSLDTAIDRISERIEEQVDSSLPPWLKNKNNDDDDHPHHLTSLRTDEIEAISGGLGDGVDEGLKIHTDGDFEGERIDGPRFEEPTEHSEEDSVEESGEDTVRNPLFPFNPFRPFGGGFPNRRQNWNIFSRRQPWWKGENVCVDREEIDEGEQEEEAENVNSKGMIGNTFIFSFGNLQMTSCSEINNKYSCTSKSSRRGIHKTVVVTYKCCHGYVKEDSGCTKVDLRDLTETMQDIGTTDFLALTEAAGVGNVLNQNLTLFVPTNEAIQEYTADLEAENEFDNDLDGERHHNEVYRRRRSTDVASIVLSHMTPGIHYATDLHDEQVVYSLADDSSLRINTYSTNPPAATVNCARLVTVNQFSTNGVVHTIDRVLQPVTKSLADLIGSDPQFSILKRLISEADLLTQLRESGQLTVFAPTDAAFNSLPESVLQSMLEGNACLSSVVKNHILPNVICSAAVQGKARTINLLESFLLLERDEEEKLFVEDAQVVARDIMATNGVLHIIDAPLMPQEAKPVMEVLEGHNLTRFLDLLETAGMTDELAGLNDVTVFAPSNRAIDELPSGVLDEIIGEPSRLREILSYHIATPTLQAGDVNNNHIATTRTDHPLRINIYSRSPLLSDFVRTSNGGRLVRMTAGCSRISNLDSRACGAVVHIVEKLLAIPKPSVVDLLEANDNFSIFSKMINDTGMSDQLKEEGPFTVLAPSDHVFRALPEHELQQLLEDEELQETLIKQHVLKEHICCAGINPNNWLFMDHKRPLAGIPVHVRRTSSGRLMAGPARITHCSSPTHNGLVHTVNHLLVNIIPNRRQHRPQGEDRVRGSPQLSMPGFEILFG